jgi:hypothetical protein
MSDDEKTTHTIIPAPTGWYVVRLSMGEEDRLTYDPIIAWDVKLSPAEPCKNGIYATDRPRRMRSGLISSA